MPHIPIERLTNFATRIFVATGAPSDIAQRVSSSLVLADTYAVHSHGIGLLPGYVQALMGDKVHPAALPTVAKDSAVSALLDGHNAFGQVVAERATQLAVEKARANGVGIVCAFRSYHVGRIGEYTEMIADAGLIGFCVVNASRIVAPFGGLARQLSTNPIAFSVPILGERPLLLDFATSTVAANKIRVYAAKGLQVPQGWILDKEGAPSTDPLDFFAGGYLLTFGGHKGYGLNLMVEVLGGLLSGTGGTMFDDFPGGNGVFIMALSPDFFRPSAEFLTDVRRLVDALRATPPLDGVARVLVPGDLEVAATARYRHDGVELDEQTWGLIVEAGKSVGVAFV